MHFAIKWESVRLSSWLHCPNTLTRVCVYWIKDLCVVCFVNNNSQKLSIVPGRYQHTKFHPNLDEFLSYVGYRCSYIHKDENTTSASKVGGFNHQHPATKTCSKRAVSGLDFTTFIYVFGGGLTIDRNRPTENTVFIPACRFPQPQSHAHTLLLSRYLSLVKEFLKLCKTQYFTVILLDRCI